MSSIFIIGLIATCALLWNRVTRLERRMALIETGPAPIADTIPDRDVAVVVPPRAQPARMPARIVPSARPEPDHVPVPEPTPTPPPVATPAKAPARGFGFEDIFGHRLPIWAGGITLAVAGFLIVKYSIDTGLLSPAVRVVFGLIFGAGLIAGAEAALRTDRLVRDPRVRQSLSGAGIATLYASVLVAANLYHLVGPIAAFVAMTAITALAGALALRFGAPSALLGLVGGLAAPALVGSGSPDVPLLAAYLALAVGGLCALSRDRRWLWLGVAALVGGFGWGLALILGGALDTAASLSIGLYVLLLAVALPLLLAGSERGRIVRLASGLAGCAQMAALVAVGGFAPLDWGLFGLLSVALLWLSRREASFAELPAMGLAIALLLTVAWRDPGAAMLGFVLAGIAAIYGIPAAWRLWSANGRVLDAGQVAAIALAIALVPLSQFRPLCGPDQDGLFALLALLGAAIAGAATAFGWTAERRRDDVRFALLATTTALALAIAAILALPDWAEAPALALAAAGLLTLGTRAGDARLERSAWGFALATVTLLVVDGLAGAAIAHAVGFRATSQGLTGAIAWAVPAAVAALFAARATIPGTTRIAQPIAVLLGYVAVAQPLPVTVLPLVPAMLLLAIGVTDRGGRALPALAASGALSIGWAVAPIVTWLASAGGALLAEPMLVTALPRLVDAATRIAAPALAIGFVLTRPNARPYPIRAVATGTGALLAMIAAHIAYKQVFAIDGDAAFVRSGMAERTLWEMLLAFAAIVAWRSRRPVMAQALAAAGFAHFAWFTALLHDPLWATQAVGPWPVANLLFPAYATAFALLWWAGRLAPPPVWVRVRDLARMALVLLFAASELRQLLHGSLPSVGTVGQGEDIARSIVAIGLAIAFLQWGIRRSARDWRIASLVLMLGAVGKVFLFDASGLDGLMRIGAFAALGFSLIAIGWLYSRYLPEPPSRAAVNP